MFYRLRQAMHYRHFKLSTGIYNSPPVSCQPEAPCAIHTMLGTKDVPLYLAAIKSFLRFYPHVAVVVHSDGTLSQREERLLFRHVPGCKLISTAEADSRARAELTSFLLECRAWDASYRRVLDTQICATTAKRIIMDSDMLTIQAPEEIIDWIQHGQAPFLFGQPPTAEPPRDPTAKKHVQTIFREELTPLSKQLGLPDDFPQGSTSGFYGCGPEELSLEKLELIIRSGMDLGIPMREWGSEQCIVIYLLAAAGAKRLSPEYYLNFDYDQVDNVARAHVVHFLGYCRFYRDIYVQAAANAMKSLRPLRITA